MSSDDSKKIQRLKEQVRQMKRLLLEAYVAGAYEGEYLFNPEDEEQAMAHARAWRSRALPQLRKTVSQQLSARRRVSQPVVTYDDIQAMLGETLARTLDASTVIAVSSATPGQKRAAVAVVKREDTVADDLLNALGLDSRCTPGQRRSITAWMKRVRRDGCA